MALSLVVIVILVVLSAACGKSVTNSPLQYPNIRRDGNVLDDYHGTKVADPYRWLEDPDSEETKAFVRAQNNLTFSYLKDAPFREEIRKKITETWNYPKRSIPVRRGDKYFYMSNSGLQNQWVLMVQNELTDAKPKVFFDPNKLSDDGTISIKSSAFTVDGSLYAYSLSQSGSDWTTIHVKNVTTGKDYPEVLRHTRHPSLAWTHDNLGFFYTRYETQDESENKTGTETEESNRQKIYYHYLGTEQDKDVLVVEFKDKPKLTLSSEVSDDGEYMLLSTLEVIDEVFLFYAPLAEAIKSKFKTKLNFKPINTEPGSLSYVTNDKAMFYFITDIDAPNHKLVLIDINKPEKKCWTTVLPEAEEVLNWVQPINYDLMFTSYTKDVKSTLELRHLENGSLIVEFPLEIGSISSTSGNRENDEFFFQLSTFTSPGRAYRINMNDSDYKPVVFQKPDHKLNTSTLVTEQVFYKSKDGTEIPMFILHRKDLVRDGNAPGYLYAYGGFGTSMEPSYSTSYSFFVNHFHGVVAIPSIRGGGEYGNDWWDDGKLLKKQNCFDDFAAAAEYLIANNYTSPSKLTINGGSNGGLLVAATVNQRPELFGAAIPEVGVMDMLRFQKFTVGFYWCGEYGCSENKTHFQNLISYSPLHNIRLPKNESVQYPAVLVMTADHDDRVVPLHSFKYISELQHTIGISKKQINPLLIRVEEKAGHGSGTPTSKKIDAVADDFAFLARALALKFYD